jgi:hypothetical protein
MEFENDERDRVRANTKPGALRRIDIRTEAMIDFYRTQPRQAVLARIEELEREWDIERLLETNASALALAGVALGIFSGKKWLLLSGGVLGFLLQHAVQGWCPPIPLLRRLGVRTQGEIDREKFSLQSMLGTLRPENFEAAAA